jgi:hypothetical protein
MGCVRRRRRYPCAVPKLDNRRKLDDFQKEMIRRCPAGDVWRLPATFDVSRHYVKKIREGAKGLPATEGMAARPWLIRARHLLEKWRTRQLARIEAAYQRALACVDNDEAISIKIEPTRDEALSLVPGEPGSLVLFRGALAIKPKPTAPPATPTGPMPAKSQAGLFYDRR